MTQLLRSPIQLECFQLKSVHFETKSIKLRQRDVPLSRIKLELTVDDSQPLTATTLCRIKLYEERGTSGDFFAVLDYYVEASITDATFATFLRKFARTGAPFNALVHARQFIADLTFKAFGKSVRVPLLNITELPRLLTVHEDAELGTTVKPEPPKEADQAPDEH